VRAHPAEYELVAPGTLPTALALLAETPGTWLPIAGGTDLMVQYSAGHLRAKKLVSIWNLPELRRVDVSPDEIRIGATSTYTDLLGQEVVTREFPLLAASARCTGGVANQNRGTLGGNIVNGSPAADSLPALLAYDADLILVSVRGERRIPYEHFHTGYRTTQRAADELVSAVCLARRFSDCRTYTRKIGARNAQAISKVCMAALARMDRGVLGDIRIAVGSVAPIPFRLRETENLLRGKRIDSGLVLLAKQTAMTEVRPIDDIRSSVRYRQAVTGNLVAEFLNGLTNENAGNDGTANKVLSHWNSLSPEDAAVEILPCCGSKSWAHQMAARRPIQTEAALLQACDEVCQTLGEPDWMEAFRHHPRIGQTTAPSTTPARSASWSTEEQKKASGTSEQLAARLANGNRAYEQRFGRIFIVCATGKSAEDILGLLQRRLANDDRIEFQESAEQQRQIANLRLKKWISA
jgi:OHCU decarboxylase